MLNWLKEPEEWPTKVIEVIEARAEAKICDREKPRNSKQALDSHFYCLSKLQERRCRAQVPMERLGKTSALSFLNPDVSDLSDDSDYGE